jgi:hypothetical protein
MLKGNASLALACLKKVIFDTLQHLPSSSTYLPWPQAASCNAACNPGLKMKKHN